MYRKNSDDVKRELEADLDRAQAILEAWKKVSYPTKKDGKPFANMKKNIEGATYKYISTYNPNPEQMEVEVFTVTKNHGYTNDSFFAYDCLYSMDKNDPRRYKTENYGKIEQYSCQRYIYDLDDIKEAVNKKIDYWTDKVEEYMITLDKLDTVYNHFYNAIDSALNDLEKEIGSKNDIYSLIKNAVKDVMN